MILFFSIFFFLYGALNYYIILRGWQALAAVPHFRPYYLVIIITAALSYFIARIFNANLPGFLYEFFLWVGSLWLAYIVYLFLLIVLIDLSRLINWQLNIYPELITANIDKTKLITGISVLIISSLIIFAGYLNTRNIQVKTVNLKMKKGESSLTELNAVLVADFHLTPINDGVLLKRIIEKINSLNPDIVLMPGDIVDDKASILSKRNIGSEFKNLKTKFGVFASNGNHEFITGIDESMNYMRKNGINVLADSAEFIDNNFYVIGRDDRAKKNFTGTERKALEEIMKNVNKKFPVIMLDHTPLKLEEAEINSVDLQLSGHTHHGQIFPANLITSMIYEISWGYGKRENTQYYVTCGVGTWGPPVRIGSSSEIVNLKITFE